MINISIHESDVFKAIGDALTPVIDGVVIKGLSNKVAPPNGDYTVITPILSERQGTNETSYITDFRSESVLSVQIGQVRLFICSSSLTTSKPCARRISMLSNISVTMVLTDSTLRRINLPSSTCCDVDCTIS